MSQVHIRNHKKPNISIVFPIATFYNLLFFGHNIKQRIHDVLWLRRNRCLIKKNRTLCGPADRCKIIRFNLRFRFVATIREVSAVFDDSSFRNMQGIGKLAPIVIGTPSVIIA
jgi:hypothetical protein